MPWILKGLLLVAKSKRGRELLFAAALAGVELAKSEQARKMYLTAQTRLAGARPRRIASELMRKATRQPHR